MIKRRSTLHRSSAIPPVTNVRQKRPRRTLAEREAARRLLSVLQAGGDARLAKIKRVRQKVKARSYENELKLSVAIDQLLNDKVLSDGPPAIAAGPVWKSMKLR